MESRSVFPYLYLALRSGRLVRFPGLLKEKVHGETQKKRICFSLSFSKFAFVLGLAQLISNGATILGLRDDQFDDLLQNSYQRVKSFIQRRVHSEHLSEDLAQETFLAAFKKRHTYREEGKPYGWLISIARNMVLNHVNRTKAPLPLIDEAEPVAEDRDDPFLAVLQREQEQLVISFFKALPPQQRQCLRLYVLGYKYREIAERMKLQLNTVKSHIFKARASAKQIWSKKDDGTRFH